MVTGMMHLEKETTLLERNFAIVSFLIFSNNGDDSTDVSPYIFVSGGLTIRELNQTAPIYLL